MGIFDRIADELGDLIAPDEAKLQVDRAQELLAEGQLGEAAETLRAVLAARPDHARAAYLLGVTLGRQGRLDEAERALAASTAARPDDPAAWVALGEARRRLGRVETAAEAFRHALEAGLADPIARGDALRGLGASYLELGRGDKAVRELRKAAALFPGDVDVQGLLGRAFALRGDLDTARVCLEKAAAAPTPDAAALLALGALYRRLARPADAEMAYLRTLQVHPAGEAGLQARLGLAQARLDLGDAAGGLGHVRQALAAAPGRADVAETLARLLAASGEIKAALDAYDDALRADANPVANHQDSSPVMLRLNAPRRRAEILDAALHAALRARQDERAASYAGELLALRPGDPDALAAQALARLAAGDLAGADALLAVARGGGSNGGERDTVETLLARAGVRMAAARAGSATESAVAAAALRRALQLAPTDPRPRALLGTVYSGVGETAPADLYTLLRAAHTRLARVPEYADLSPEAARVLELLDRPLLVTVMGEFNSGKSTFVNALVGEEVAPMGIVPTTATINVLKYGAERGARVIYRDGAVKDVPWQDVPALLRGLAADEARRIRLVEVRHPLAVLERVNVVDTPGLNSILPEHEATAREFIAQADAVVWLFTVGQAGTASEREALERVRAEKKKVLGVVNKIDRAGEDERKEILAHLESHFGDLVEALVPFSAREALLGRSDPERLARSNRARLEALLEERFYARSEAIKREAAERRIGALLDEARGRAETIAAASAARSSELDASQSAVRADLLLFQRRFLVEERRRLRIDHEALLLDASHEVLDFVRPRRWAFGSNQAQPADRDYLIALAEERLATLGDESRARVAAELERARATTASLEDGDAAEADLRLLDFEVYGRYRAFMRGYLRGGRVDDFFARVLPRLELNEIAIRRALEQGLLGADVLDGELLQPLKVWSERHFAGRLARFGRLAQVESLARFEIEERLVRPVAELGRALSALASTPRAPTPE